MKFEESVSSSRNSQIPIRQTETQPKAMTEEDIVRIFEAMAEKWSSSFVSRDQVFKFTGGAVSNGRMANLDSLGEGPERFRLGRKIVYPVKPFIEWLIARSLPVENRVR